MYEKSDILSLNVSAYEQNTPRIDRKRYATSLKNQAVLSKIR